MGSGYFFQDSFIGAGINVTVTFSTAEGVAQNEDSFLFEYLDPYAPAIVLFRPSYAYEYTTSEVYVELQMVDISSEVGLAITFTDKVTGAATAATATALVRLSMDTSFADDAQYAVS